MCYNLYIPPEQPSGATIFLWRFFMKKRVCALLMSICIAIGLMLQFPVTALAASSGTWGGIDWTLYNDGTLTISPTQNTITKTKPWSGELYQVGEWPAAVNDAISKVEGWPYDLKAVKKLVIEEGVTSIGSFAIQNCPNLTGEVIIPSTVTYIGQEAFQNDPITKLIFASGGTGKLCIAPGAFKALNITDLVLPADRSEIHIHCWAFQGCPNLENISIPANVSTFSQWTHVDYAGMGYIDGYDSQIFSGAPKIKNIAFENEDVKSKFFTAPGNQANMNALNSLLPPHLGHACRHSNWNWDEHNHYKKMCVYSTCPLNLSQKLFSLGAHTFGADDSCTVCGYIQNSKNKAPKTGDTTNTLLWTALFLGGVAMMWMQLNTRKREMF